MNKILAATALSALAIVGLVGSAQAECYWGGNHWNCPGGRYIYPKSFPPDTIVSNGVYSRPMSPSPSDVTGTTQPPAPQQ